MRHFTDETLRKMTKADLLKHLSGASKNDMPIGTVRIEDLPEGFFRMIIRQQNSKIESFLLDFPKDRHSFGSQMKFLRIPTYREYQRLLDDPDRRKTIDPSVRKPQDFFRYRQWVLREAPLGTLFQYFVKKPFEYYLPFRFRKMHSILIGGSGSGKSECLKALMLRDKTSHSNQKAPVSTRLAVVLIEPHGDLSEELARQKVFYDDFKFHQEQGHEPNLIYIEPLLAHDQGRYPVWNPFDVDGSLTDIELGKLAQQLSAAIVAMLGSGNELSLTMDTLLNPCLFLLLKRPGSTFRGLLRLMNDDAELVELGKASPNPEHRQFFSERFLSASFKRTKASISVKIQSLLNHPAFTAMTCSQQSSFDLEKAIQNGKTVVISLSKGKLGEVGNSIGKLFLARILALAINRADSKKYRVPISLVVDEMQNYISPSLEPILSESRKYGLMLTAAQQVIGQGMDSALTKMILGNTAVKGIGRAGHHSQEHMAREMGVPVAFVQHLSVGQFVFRCDDNPAVQIQMTSEYVGDNTLMTDEQWEELKQFMIDRYYVKESATITNSESKDSQLAEEISSSNISSNLPEHTSPIEIDHFDLGDEE